MTVDGLARPRPYHQTAKVGHSAIRLRPLSAAMTMAMAPPINRSTGSTGTQGATGTAGATGTQGNTGLTGASGLAGNTGVQGATGTTGAPDSSYPSLAHRIAYLFNSGTRPYDRRPELAEVVPPELYERGRQLATRLVEHVSPTALLHGDLTPSNILDGGNKRGLVAIDPAPCLGDDFAFEAVDLLLWQAEDVDMIAARAERLGPLIDMDPRRLLNWCTAFAAMVALELAEAPNSPRERIEPTLTLASQAPTR